MGKQAGCDDMRARADAGEQAYISGVSFDHELGRRGRSRERRTIRRYEKKSVKGVKTSGSSGVKTC